jgi:hypothetical protein
MAQPQRTALQTLVVAVELVVVVQVQSVAQVAQV